MDWGDFYCLRFYIGDGAAVAGLVSGVQIAERIFVAVYMFLVGLYSELVVRAWWRRRKR